jgi:hypothetical protein
LLPGGTIIGTTDYIGQVLRETDLMGNLVRETTSQRVSEQMIALGYPGISQFSHDAIRLRNGYTAAIASAELIADQGAGPIDVLADVVVVLDTNWQVAWVWNSLQKLNLKRPAILGETCNTGGGACPPLTLGPIGNDWTHANALQQTSDGNLILCVRNQDWLVKIDYRDGMGSGDVIWRMGPNGDFKAISSEASPWFTHPHDATITADGTLTIFDNGNTRYREAGGDGNSRGQVWKIDEVNRTATLLVNDTLPGYSQALGWAQYTSNGNLFFESGFLKQGTEADAYEVDPAGNIVYRMVFNSPAYRVTRTLDLYTPVQ